MQFHSAKWVDGVGRRRDGACASSWTGALAVPPRRQLGRERRLRSSLRGGATEFKLIMAFAAAIPPALHNTGSRVFAMDSDHWFVVRGKTQELFWRHLQDFLEEGQASPAPAGLEAKL